MQSTCAIYAMNSGLAQEATEKRMQAQLQNGMMSNNQRVNSGMN